MALDSKYSYCDKCHVGYETLNPPRIKCPLCGGDMVNTPLTFEEEFLIKRTSKDWDFLLAMIELKKNDIIEFQTRISQFRAQAKADGCYGKPKNIPRCPKCGSTAITTGARGANHFWGFIGASKTVNRCGNCGYTWKPKG